MNEHDQLKTVIVGRESFKFTDIQDTHFKEFYGSSSGFSIIKHFKEKVKNLSKRNEYLDNLSSIFIDKDIKVLRPNIENNIDSNIRDFLVILNDTILICNPYLDTRKEGYKKYIDLVNDYKLIYAPRTDEYIKRDVYQYDMEKGIEQFEKSSNEYFPLFDAANILKCNNGLIMNISNHNEYSGYLWLKEQIDIQIYPVFIDNSHIDGALNIVNDDILLICFDSSIITESNFIKKLPKHLQTYKDIITVDKTYDNKNVIASKGGMFINILSINHNTVIVDKESEYVIEQLKLRGLEVIELDVHGSRLFGGGIHCTTLDLKRF